jgi:hypothetical protein
MIVTSSAYATNYAYCPVQYTLPNENSCVADDVGNSSRVLNAEVQFVPNYYGFGAVVWDSVNPFPVYSYFGSKLQYRVTMYCAAAGMTMDSGWMNYSTSVDGQWQGGLLCPTGYGNWASIQVRIDSSLPVTCGSYTATVAGLCDTDHRDGRPW